MAAKKKVDYDRIEPGWRAGIKSPQQLAEEYTKETGVLVTRVAIIKHFGKAAISRDLGARIQAKADAMMAEALVTGKVSVATTMREAEVICSNAVTQTTIRLSQQKRINTSTDLVDLLTEQLIAVAGQREEFEEAIEEMTEEDRSGERRARLMKAISLPVHATTAVSLANALKTLIGLQNDAYGIRQTNTNPDELASNPARGVVFKIVRPE